MKMCLNKTRQTVLNLNIRVVQYLRDKKEIYYLINETFHVHLWVMFNLTGLNYFRHFPSRLP